MQPQPRPLALITSQPTIKAYTVLSIGVVLFFWPFFCMAASANVRIWNPRSFCLAFRILVVVPSPYAYIQKSKIQYIVLLHPSRGSYCLTVQNSSRIPAAGIEPTRDFGIWHQIFPTTFSSKFSSCSVESFQVRILH